VGGVRTKNWSNTELYVQELGKGRRAIESRDELPPRRRAGESAAFGLRMNRGWDLGQFRTITGFDLAREWGPEIAQLVDCGWGVLEPNRFRLTPGGLRFADAAAESFLVAECVTLPEASVLGGSDAEEAPPRPATARGRAASTSRAPSTPVR
jgi:coproporphyrinogen III oxidase-like Fe-S oxidoreductase